ncbi:hypothetical protein [Natronobacterium texcoconense]|uniref:Uncharacterized protein n=1 Tax=Natronobacterium texcoconense TaxID=1095778 RepID=A0A1H0YZF9_NATTX|nr:hypothetical protein [Natronobacterium texcoconense]SDQ20575.1 hypothetical protein SAMN04489842_0072 [Natronobacterium texcoconense]
MAAFTPEPTASAFELANWLFVRFVVLAVLTFYVAMVASELLVSLVGLGFEHTFFARVTVYLAGLWIALQLWFEATRVLVETADSNGSSDGRASTDGGAADGSA